MLLLTEASKRLRLRWHEYWMDVHNAAMVSARDEMWSFLEIGDQSEATHMAVVTETEKTLAAFHARKVINLLDEMS